MKFNIDVERCRRESGEESLNIFDFRPSLDHPEIDAFHVSYTSSYDNQRWEIASTYYLYNSALECEDFIIEKINEAAERSFKRDMDHLSSEDFPN